MLTITPLRALQDNYIWMLIAESMQKIWVVDPGDAEPVIRILKQKKWTLAGILLTHHHYDHSGGIEALLEYAGYIPVYGSNQSSIRSVNHGLKDGDRFSCA